MKKKVLLTNFNMVNYSGSELDTLTIANYFLSKSYDVTIFTIEAGYPLINEIDKRINIVECIENDKLEKHYDLIWAHHYPLLDFLLFTKKIEADHVAYISLSSYETYETIPPYYQHLNYVSILSKEGLDVLKKDGYDISNINILGNYSFKKYYDGKRKRVNKKIKKICVVSNHVPQEIIECRKMFEKNNVQFDIYGKEYKYVKVDDKLLKEYDIIISIAKTIYYGLSLGIPVYIYDHFGGDGYITKENIKKSHDYNFSGRFSRRKLTGSEIYKDIVDNYEVAVKSIEYNFDYAYKTFCFEEQMNLIVNNINSKKKFNINNIYNNFEVYIKTSGLFMREMINLQMKKNKIDYKNIKNCKCYFDYGKGFNESDSKIYYYKKYDDIYYVNIDVDSKMLNLRFDLIDKPFVIIDYIKINDKMVKLIDTTNIIEIENIKISVNDDPNVVINNIKNKKLKIEIKMNTNFENIIINGYKNKISQINELSTNLNIYENKLKLIENSRSYKFLTKIRAIMAKINFIKK